MYELKTVVLSLSCTLKLPEESLQAAPQSNLTRILRVGFDIKKKSFWKLSHVIPKSSQNWERSTLKFITTLYSEFVTHFPQEVCYFLNYYFTQRIDG